MYYAYTDEVAAERPLVVDLYPAVAEEEYCADEARRVRVAFIRRVLQQ